MKLQTLFPLVLAGSLVCFSAAGTTTAPMLKNDKDKLSYSMGFMTGQTFKAHHVDIDPRFFALGFDDAIQDNKSLLTQKEMQTMIQNFQKQSQAEAAEKIKKMAEDNLTAGKKFLAANKKASGVVTLPSGLQYKILKVGTGPKPKSTDTVEVNYEGKLLNGKIFDSSYERGQPAIFAVNQVIKGWQDALVMMPVGSEWQLFIPADQAYGDANIPNIGPNQVLMFKVTLLGIKNQK